MRTGIYVYASTTLTIKASEAITLTLMSSTPQTVTPDGNGQVTVGPGIYKAVTEFDIAVSCSDSADVCVVVKSNNKDGWPDPPLQAKDMFGVTQIGLNSFFAIPGAMSAAF